MAKPKLFIGCVQEEKPLAEEVQRILDEVADVKIWDYKTFFPGEHTLESLRREVLYSDFAVLIATPDDKITKKEKKGFAARDNILIELGLFMGVQGPAKALYVTVTKVSEKGRKQVLIPSDLAGLTCIQLTIEEGKDNASAIRKACTEIKDAIKRAANAISINLLPSTALAIGYFNNFVLQVCRTLITLSNFQLDNNTYDLTKDIYDFYVVLPDNASDASHEGFAKFVRKNNLKAIEIKNEPKSRTFPFYVDSVLRNGRILLFDYPTTLRSVREAIRLAVTLNATEEEVQGLEEREIHNFKKTLEKLLKEPTAADFRDNIKVIYLSQLPEIYNKKR